MENKSSKTEQKAITKVRNLIDGIDTARSNLNENDKGISWDGQIYFYSNDKVDKKENYQFSVTVQVKGRTINKKKLYDTFSFDLDTRDLENYKKIDGTLLLICVFKKDSDTYKMYYKDLLPYEINRLLKNASSKTKIKLREIKNSSHLEEICRNFDIQRNIQKGIPEKILNQDNISLIQKDGSLTKFFVWKKDKNLFDPSELLGTEKYIYTFDKETGYVTNIDYAMLYSVATNINVTITDKNKTITFNDIQLLRTIDEEKIVFGKAFSFIPKNEKHEIDFKINICGTLYERINQLNFIISVINENCLYINDMEINVFGDINTTEKFKKLLDEYKLIEEFLKKHSIKIDLELDKWELNDVNRLMTWMDAIDNKTHLNLKSDISLIGSYQIQELRLSFFARKLKDNSFEIESIWNNHMDQKYSLRYGDDKNYIETKNLFLMLNSETYLSNDINYDEMRSSIKEETDKYEELINLQVLEVLKAYDKKVANNIIDNNLLDYALYLIQLIINCKENYFVYYINYCQILKRQNKLTENEQKELLRIRDNSEDIQIKLCCNILLGNKVETNILIQKLNQDTLKIFREYPIAIFI